MQELPDAACSFYRPLATYGDRQFGITVAGPRGLGKSGSGGVQITRLGYILGMPTGSVWNKSASTDSRRGWRFAGRHRLIIGAGLAIAALAAGIGGCERKTRDSDIKMISLAEVKLLLDRQAGGREGEIVLVDPRPVRTYEAGHIPGARNIQLPQINPRGSGDPSLARYHNIVVYGEDPGSAVARGMTKRLMAVGHRGVRLYAGGMREWTGRGFEVATITPQEPVEAARPVEAVEPEAP